jgi:hypothetical protein
MSGSSAVRLRSSARVAVLTSLGACGGDGVADAGRTPASTVEPGADGTVVTVVTTVTELVTSNTGP